MSLDVRRYLHWGEELLEAIERKSWHHSTNAAHYCLCAMPQPAWAEQEPGIATYGPGEYEANQRVNALRCNVATWLIALCDPNRTWEASDEWPKPQKLQAAVDRLRELCPVES